MKKFRTCLFGTFLLCILLPAYGDFTAEKETQNFIKYFSEKYHWSQESLHHIFKEAERLPHILEIMKKPAEKKPWHQYQKNLLSFQRIAAGKIFLHTHHDALERAEKTYGVPKEIIVAILGVETFYGKNTGNYRVIDTLSTLAFMYPARRDFFEQELESFLLLAKEEGWNITEPKGSYAGAMGLPQFMPSSYRDYAVDFSHEGKRDLIHNTNDAIGSVANYLSQKGWQAHAPIALPTTVTDKAKLASLPEFTSLIPEFTLNHLAQKGWQIPEFLNTTQKAAILSVEDSPTSTEFWLIFDNFYVITRYNHSPLYALAVLQLSEKLK